MTRKTSRKSAKNAATKSAATKTVARRVPAKATKRRSIRSKLLRPLESRCIPVVEVPAYSSDGPDAFAVVATAPSALHLYLVNARGELTIGFGEHWHCHVRVTEIERAIELVESLVSGTSAIVEWHSVKGKYTGSGCVPVSEVPGRRHGDRFVVLTWEGPRSSGGAAAV